MDDLERRLTELLARWDCERSAGEVVALGPAALGRLLDAKDGKGALWREGVDPRDYEDALQAAIAAFGARDVDGVLAEMRTRGWSAERVALSGLGRIADARVVPAVLELFASKDAFDRLRAVGLLAMQRDPAAVEALVRALSDRAESVRHAAIEGLGQRGDPTAIEALQAVVKRSAGKRWIAEAARAAIEKIRRAGPKRATTRAPRGAIDEATGAIALEGVTVGPSTTLTALRRSALGGQLEDQKVGEPPWETHSAGAREIAGRRFATSLSFEGGRLRWLGLSLRDEKEGASWAEWSEKRERRRKGEHDAWLRETLGAPTRVDEVGAQYEYPWGRVLSWLDPRSGGAAIVVSYADPGARGGGAASGARSRRARPRRDKGGSE